MKATLEFDMNDLDDVKSHKRMILSDDIVFCIWQFDQYLRGQIKYNEDLTQEAHDALEDAREKLHELLNDKSINLDTI